MNFGYLKLPHCDAFLEWCICNLITSPIFLWWALCYATLSPAKHGHECHLSLISGGFHYASVLLPIWQWIINGVSYSLKFYLPFISKYLVTCFGAVNIPPTPWFLFMSFAIFVQLLSFCFIFTTFLENWFYMVCESWQLSCLGHR